MVSKRRRAACEGPVCIPKCWGSAVALAQGWGSALQALGSCEKCLNQVFIFNRALNCLSICVQQR